MKNTWLGFPQWNTYVLDKNWIDITRICASAIHCVINWQLVGVLPHLKEDNFFLKERKKFSYPGNFEAKRIFICHVCWSTKQTERCDLLV